ncbi:WD40 repeat-like protein [Massarina eburnea CBS 473.64]|uniref:WD40 repeat-like protein n=1 Tax=Massarina eburnea CBS 473.64 TaxID=1395130 RepID=A0A6A6SFC8_9PLEO|nr:WD40 repeat-like protein [Massarina eburnea CBS 473.64]
MAPRMLTPTLSSNLGLPPNSYIYKIISTAPRQDPLTYSRTDQLAVISSDDSLCFLDSATLNPNGVIKNVNDKVTCLERANDLPSNIVATAGRDGLLQLWDKRSRQRVMSVQSPHKLISSIVCDYQKNFIAAGIENPDDGPNSSPVYVWDQRNIQAPLREFVESHTDTVTSLQLHPNLPTLLLSASTDGLVNIFDTSKPDEDDALYQVINHRSAVAHAGFMYSSTDIYAIGTDETLSFYALQSQAEEQSEPTPKAFGDTREQFDCEYLAKMHWVGSDAYIATGKHSSGELRLFPVQKNAQAGPLEYNCNAEGTLQLPGAHGEEIVRDLFTDVHTRTTYTCGEDGYVRAWVSQDSETMDIDEASETKSSSKSKDRKEKRKDKKDKRKGDERFAPY